MTRPNRSWRPTTTQLTTTAIAIVFLLLGFWIGWQHRSSIDPNSVTPSVPRNMRTHAVRVIPPITVPTSTAPTGTSGTSSTDTTPGPALPPRAQTRIAVFNAGGTPGVAVQLAVSIVQLGYPTPVTGNVSLPTNQLPTSTAPAAPTPPTTPTTTPTVPVTSTAPTSTAPRSEPQTIYYRVGEQAVANRLGTDLGITNIAPVPTVGPLVSTAPSAQLIVVVGSA